MRHDVSQDFGTISGLLQDFSPGPNDHLFIYHGENIMKNYFEHRGLAQQLIFDPISKQFVARSAPHPFTTYADPLEQHLLADLGIDANALTGGTLKLAA